MNHVCIALLLAMAEYKSFASLPSLNSESLSGIIIEINGNPKFIESESKLNIVWGDKIVIKEALFEQPVNDQIVVNFIGYPNNNSSNPSQDLDLIIKTNADLQDKWSINPEKNEYEIKVSLGRRIVGGIKVHLLNPRFNYGILAVNGHELVFREGSIVSLKKTDHFKVKEIFTNIESPDKSVNFAINSIKDTSFTAGAHYAQNDYEIHELILYRYDKEFARIPLHIKN